MLELGRTAKKLAKFADRDMFLAEYTVNETICKTEDQRLSEIWTHKRKEVSCQLLHAVVISQRY